MSSNLSAEFRAIDPAGSPPGLPIYRLDQPRQSVFYTPGVVTVVDDEQAEEIERFLTGKDSATLRKDSLRIAKRLLHKAQIAIERYFALIEEPFEPECLTLYLHTHCNLECRYCLRDESTEHRLTLQANAVSAAAQLVAESCKRKQKPLTVVFHGWGEPTYDFRLLQELVQAVDATAKRNGVSQFRYIATNGIVPVEVAEYVGRTFDLVSLSCDGPPEFQNAQRPIEDAEKTDEIIYRTSSIIRESGKRLAVRATIMNSTLSCQEEIADYVIRNLQPHEIRFEPVYRASSDGLHPNDAELYTEHFLKAQELAAHAGISLSFSGSRVHEIHGPYCNVFRNVLNLMPDGGATACFAQSGEKSDIRFVIGADGGREYTLDFEKIGSLRQTLSRRSDICRFCFNNYHCVGLCPDNCVLDHEQVETSDYSRSFRCRIQKLTAAKQILGRAESSAGDTVPASLIDI